MIRLGCVPYLNALPLTYFLNPREVEILRRPPSQLKDLLMKGRVDAALLPIVDYFETPQLHLVPEVAIVSKGAVQSVKLFIQKFNQPIEKLKYLYLDPESKTSQLLLKVLLRFRFQHSLTDFHFLSDPRDPHIEASLLIGDKALHCPFPQNSLDLGEAWWKWTQKPFVFAAWMARDPNQTKLSSSLRQARDQGVKNIRKIIEEKNAPSSSNSASSGFSLKEYLTKAVQYYMGPEELEGIRLFFNYLKPIAAYRHELDFRFIS
jgi:chorismate dehydratase